MVSAGRLCLECKGGRALCGQARCPLLARVSIVPKIEQMLGQEFFGPSVSVFVGRIGYPRVGVGPLAAIDAAANEGAENLDNPHSWIGKEYSDIIQMRSSLLRSKSSENVKSRSRFAQETQELALAGKPTDLELRFRKRPVYRVSFSDIVQPMGPSASIEKIRIAENVRVPREIDRIVSDEMKAAESSFKIYKTTGDVYKTTTILSSGALGLERDRKMVPTRWSITAVDDMIFRQLVSEVKQMRQLDEYLVFSSEYLDNHFEILMMPGSWEYENFEAWAPGSFWAGQIKSAEIVEEYEPYRGRTDYADKEGGGYYAARLAAVEALHRLKKQARVVVFREVYEGYMVPLGVWVVREAARKAFESRPKRFSTAEEARDHLKKSLRIPLSDYIKKSLILRQARLNNF